MPARDYESAPITEHLGLDDVIRGLAKDIEDLRAKKISAQDAHARAAIAKQLFNGVRLYLQAMQTIQTMAKPVSNSGITLEAED